MAENMKKLPIPLELYHPFFFSEKEMSLDLADKSLWTGDNFRYEILFYNGIVANKPWTNPVEFLPQILDEWNRLKIGIEELHHQRKKNGVIEKMKNGTGLFLQYLFWSNEKPVCLKELPAFPDLSMKPVNLEERAAFIIARPGIHHAYVQLCELMIEQEKLFAKKITIKKASSRS
ncbi:YpoC family protein [Bacillus sp. EB600]|uniref:YpoC family protein n=1 Tax=Bacillus sp. EB600 TaxID=2806345 RepID=UPI002108C081|nr:hypothetical protein [Bacillus sp. EB600]MCQ6277884.1 hypothetical protein [Bacillus sp. EB600]